MPSDHPRALLERASLHDFLGEEAAAIPLYRAALEAGLDDPIRTEARFQLASSLRNVGDPAGAMATLQEVAPEHDLADAARAFLALALYDDGKPAAALRTALQALSTHLPAYERSVDAYAEDLVAPDRVRIIAIGILVRDGWILAEEYVGPDGDRFLRAPGGGVEFGERVEDAVRREFREELDVARRCSAARRCREHLLHARQTRARDRLRLRDPVRRARSPAAVAAPRGARR